MHGTKPAGVLFLLAASLLAASTSPYHGRVVLSHAAAAGTSASARLHTASPTLTRRQEDEVAPEMMSWAASLLGGDFNSYGGVYNSDRAACDPHCPGKGRPYTGRGCQAIYGCSTGPTQSNS